MIEMKHVVEDLKERIRLTMVTDESLSAGALSKIYAPFIDSPQDLKVLCVFADLIWVSLLYKHGKEETSEKIDLLEEETLKAINSRPGNFATGKQIDILASLIIQNKRTLMELHAKIDRLQATK